MSEATRKPLTVFGRATLYIRQEIATIPNAITAVRLACALGMLAWPEEVILVSTLALVGALSDIFDGLIAKLFGWSTAFGKRLDQYVDWLFGVALLYDVYRIEGVVLHEWPYSGALLGLIGGYLLLRAMFPLADTTVIAKTKTFMQFAGGVSILGGHALASDVLLTGGYLLVWSSIGLMVKSLWDYVKN